MPTLIDGRDVAGDSPEWAQECLARHVLKMPLQDRRAWLADFEKKNGRAAQELRQVVAAVHADKKRHKATKADTAK